MSGTSSPAPRRRAATPRRGKPGGSSVAAVLLVLLAAAALALTRPGPAPAPDVRPTSGDLMSRSLLACPDQKPARGVDTTVDLGLARADGLGDGGSVRAGPIDRKGSDLDITRGAFVDVPATGGPKVDSAGASAAGLFGFRTDSDAKGTLGISPCATPRAQWWFTGAGAGLDHSSTLVVSNVDPGPAVVDLRVLGPTGEIATVATSGITVPPNSTTRIDLTGVAPQTDELALSVHANRGRVVASVDDSVTGRAGAVGQDWVPGNELPSRVLHLAGAPAKADERTLLVANPSELEAIVELKVAGASGAFTPAGMDSLTLAPGSVQIVDLGKVLPAKEAVALRLVSRVPVLASLRSTDGGDQAYAGAVTSLAGPAAAPVVRRAETSVQLTAGPREARALVTAYDKAGKHVDSKRLTISPTATAAWSPKKGADYVVVSPVDGAVHGAVSYAGDGLAAVPLTPLPIRVQRPSVVPDLR